MDKLKNCLHCKKETTNLKYCSRSCSAKETNKTPKRKLNRKCVKCNNIVKHHRTTFCNYHFEDNLKSKKEYVENLTLFDYTERECIKRLFPSSKFAHIRALNRRWNKDLIKLPCHNCGYDKHVELAHIKPICSFSPFDKVKEVNDKKNVIQLCPNCHWEFDNIGFDLNIK